MPKLQIDRVDIVGLDAGTAATTERQLRDAEKKWVTRLAIEERALPNWPDHGWVAGTLKLEIHFESRSKAGETS